MSTSYSKRAAELQEISLQLEHGQQQASDIAWFESLGNVSSRLAAMQPDMSRMQTKAAEPDPNKRIYGKAMVTKVMALVQQYAELVQQVKEHQAAAAKVTSAQTAASSPSASGTVFTGNGNASSGSAAAAADAQMAAETVRKANKQAATAVPPSADPEASAQPLTNLSLPSQSPSASSVSAAQGSSNNPAPGRAHPSPESNHLPPTQLDGLDSRNINESDDQRADGKHAAGGKNSAGSSAGSVSSTAHEHEQPAGDATHSSSQQPYLAVCPPFHATSVSAPKESAQAAGSRPADSSAMTATASMRPPEPSASSGNVQPLQASPAASHGGTVKAGALPSGQSSLAAVDLPRISTGASLAASTATATDTPSPGHPVLGPTSPRFPTADQAAASSLASFTPEVAPSMQLPASNPPQSTSNSASAPNTASVAPASEAADARRLASGTAPVVAGSTATTTSQAAASEEALGSHQRTARPPVGHVLELRQGRAQFDRLLQEMATSMEADAEDLLVLDFQATWCGPCKMMVPVVEQLAREMVRQAVFVSVDAEATPMNNSFANEMQIRGFPTFYIFARSMPAILPGAARSSFQQLETFSGARPVAALRTSLYAHYDTLKSPGATVSRLHSTLSTLKQGTSFADFLAATKLLLLFVSNVLAHSDDPKYKRVKASNSRYQTAVGSKQGGPACMLALGFRLQRIDGQQVFVMHEQPAGLAEVKRLLEQAMAAASQAAPAAAAAATLPQSQPAAPAVGQSTPSLAPGSTSTALPAAMASQLAAMLRSGAPVQSAMSAPQQQGQPGSSAAQGANSRAGASTPDAAALARQLARMLSSDAPRPAGSQHQTSSRGSLSSVSQPASGSASGVAQSGPNLSGAASSSSPLQSTQHAQAGNVSSVSQPPPLAAAAADVAIGNQQQESTGQDASLSEEDLLRIAIEESMKDEGSAQ